MAITRVAQFGPAAVASGNLNITWTASPVAGDLIILNIISTTGQTLPSTLPGWTTVFIDGSGAGFISGQYTRTTDGTEAGALTVMSVTVPTIAWMTEYHTDQNGKTLSVVTGSYGADIDDGATGIQISSTTGLLTTANDWIESGTVWTSTTPSNPTAPVTAAGRSVTQTGATLGAIQNRASTTWLTNYRYNLADIPVTTGASAAVKYSSNASTSSLRGITNFAILRETVVAAPQLSADAGFDQVVDSLQGVSLQGTGNGTSWVWRQISGTTVVLSSMSAQNPTFKSPATVAGDTLIFGLKVGDGTSQSTEDTVSITVLPQTEWVLQNGAWVGDSTTLL